MSRSRALVTRVACPVPIFSTNTFRRFSHGCINARYSPFGESENPTLTGLRKKSFIGISGGRADFAGRRVCAEAASGTSNIMDSKGTKNFVFIGILLEKKIGGCALYYVYAIIRVGEFACHPSLHRFASILRWYDYGTAFAKYNTQLFFAAQIAGARVRAMAKRTS